MKKIIITLLLALLIPFTTNAQVNVNQGGTGISSVPVNNIVVGSTAFKLTSTSSPTVGYVVATSTTASIFPYASTTAISSGNAWFTGNVGIGSTTPFNLLSIDGATGSNIIGIRNTSNAVVVNDIAQSLQTFTKDLSNITNRNTSYINIVDDQVDYAGIAAPTRIEFGTQSTSGGAPTTKLTVGNTNVGIGTTTPSSLFHIVTTSTSGNTLGLQYDNAGNGGNWSINPFIATISNGGLSFVDKQNVTTPFVISNAGFLGSGTTTPRVQLSASATGFVQGELWGQTNTQSASLRLVNDAGITGKIGVYGSAFATANLRNNLFLAADSATSDIVFGHTNLTELMRLKGTGLLGIGTSTPAFTLDVKGAAANVAVFSGTGLKAVAIGSSVANGAYIQGYTSENATSTTDLDLEANGGNVGIGTASPTRLLHLFSSSINVLNRIESTFGTAGLELVSANASPAQISFGDAGATYWTMSKLGSGSSRDFQLANGVTGQGSFYIKNSNDNVGLSTTSPSERFTVNGNAYIAGTLYSTSTVQFTALTAFATGDSAVCQRAGGLITVDSGVSSCIVSTKAAKHDIKSSETVSSLERIMKLNPVAFEYNEGNKPDIGLIAEEVASVDARYAQYDPKTLKPKAINWAAITSDLIKTTQDQENRIEALEKLNGIKPNRGSVLPTVFSVGGLLVGAGGIYLAKKKKS